MSGYSGRFKGRQVIRFFRKEVVEVLKFIGILLNAELLQSGTSWVAASLIITAFTQPLNSTIETQDSAEMVPGKWLSTLEDSTGEWDQAWTGNFIWSMVRGQGIFRFSWRFREALIGRLPPAGLDNSRITLNPSRFHYFPSSCSAQ
jgi:hypothetical protein